MISDTETLERFVFYVASKDGFTEACRSLCGIEAWRLVQSTLHSHDDAGKATIELLRSWITADFKDVTGSFWRLESTLFPLTYSYEAGRLQRIAGIENPEESLSTSLSLLKKALGYDKDGFTYLAKDPSPWPRYVNGVDHFFTALVCRIATGKEGTAYQHWRKWGLFFALADCGCCDQLNEKAFTTEWAASQEGTDVGVNKEAAFALSTF